MRSLIFCLIWLPAINYASSDFDRDQIQKRIAPIGKVRIAGQVNENEAESKEAIEPVAVKPATGQEIYDKYCMVCHKIGLAGAPKYSDKNDWEPRLAGRNIDELTASAIKGIKAMPARGTCMECSNEEIKLAVEYMVGK